MKFFEIDESSSCYSVKTESKFYPHLSEFSDSGSSADSNPSRDRPSSTHETDDNVRIIPLKCRKIQFFSNVMIMKIKL